MTRRSFSIALAAASTLLRAQDQPKPKKLEADELKGLLGEKQKYFFLDVREPKEIEEIGTVKGYVNIPIGQLESRLSEVPKDKIIVTMCNRAARAGKAAELLAKNGYKVAGACALFEYKEKKYDLVYPKAEGAK